MADEEGEVEFAKEGDGEDGWVVGVCWRGEGGEGWGNTGWFLVWGEEVVGDVFYEDAFALY